MPFDVLPDVFAVRKSLTRRNGFPSECFCSTLFLLSQGEGEWSRGLGCNLGAHALMGKMNRSRCPGDKFNQSSLLLCNIFCLPKRPPALHDCSFHSSDRIAERSDVADFCSLKEPFRFLSCRLMTFPAKFQISPSPISSRNFGT